MNKYSFITLVAIVSLTACKKNTLEIPKIQGEYNGNLAENQFYFQLLKNDGRIMTEAEADSLKLFYINAEGKRQYEYSSPTVIMDYPQHIFKPSFISINDAGLDSMGILVSRDVGPYFSHYWYFEYPNGDIDTLYVEQKNILDEEGLKDPCWCNFPFTVVKLNGKDATIHPTLTSATHKQIYVLRP